MLADMDNTGSYDSVVSGQSAFSDDSLEHLSAEEKACLMFLEETIESLDTEDDSGLANDEVDLLPDPGCLASRLAHLSASMSKSKLNGLQKHNALETIREKVENKAIQNYLVPTPFVLASGSNCCEPSVKAGIQLNKKSLSLSQKPAGVHEVNAMKPPASKAKDHFVKTGERGPLSYDALVYLRRSASTKKTPLCPTVDHTIGPPVIIEDPKTGNVGRLDRAISKVSRFMAGPPPVVPKLPKMSSHISAKREKEATPAPNSSYSLKNATDPKVVRREALQKLGLLKDQRSETTQLELPKSYLSAGNGFSKRLTNVSPLRSPSFCQAPAPGPGPRNKGLQSSASFHHDSRATSLSHPNQLNRLKVASPEQPTVLVKHKNDMNHSELKSVIEDPPVAPKASDCVTYTVMMVPGMDADRKEALRKLGLLKDK
ncbi:specifically androgen-regulated gene protein [Syngnathus acus]|uniref:specifically androgen-regulated gene protein n=1 Tax=Syngnathus acus TaxID=161584 RepID=UPI0018863F85|nr:specifically androgen-regulated gene protein [Syngnathus acus]XP_037106991.1 specifically androgen-regulated gene protein [Syngnathus acus]XP_037106992.1 specifically androgen-regulated gene protein [Syngnathus acus]